ncbi:hypothetical protein NDU88_001106 [Pleurodeles waltl]|uniref:Uncharacterized protein n=1 Tax=Pleurodeles waltl TaxID=8319 RepID=A0AAV7VAX9_PLEWA|nr:hypothetical protein NDU88_001106 [Pleurodeles waltl]
MNRYPGNNRPRGARFLRVEQVSRQPQTTSDPPFERHKSQTNSEILSAEYWTYDVSADDHREMIMHSNLIG